MGSFLSSCQDLLLPRCCVACGAGHEWLCAGHDAAAQRGVAGFPQVDRGAVTHCQEGQVWSARPYEMLERAIILGYKESGYRHLVTTIARWLTMAVLQTCTPDDRLVLVPIPSSVRSRVDRGTDTWLDVCRRAGTALGDRASVHRLLQRRRSWRPTSAQKMLTRSQRLRNATRRFVARPDLLPALVPGGSLETPNPASEMGARAGPRKPPPPRRGDHRPSSKGGVRSGWSPDGAATNFKTERPVRVIVVDDVITTGATIYEGIGTLQAAGITCDRAATACAVQRGGRQRD